MASLDAPGVPAATVLTNNEDFNSRSLMAQAPGSSPSPSESRGSPSASFLFDPNRFFMSQSYTLSFTSGSAGSFASGVYLNSMSYRLSDPLTLSADMGFFIPIASTLPGSRPNGPGSGEGMQPSLIFPHIGLNYQPSENFSMSVDLVNQRDAWKAYGPEGSLPPQTLWNRLP